MKPASQVFEDMIENYELIGRQIKALGPRLIELEKELGQLYHKIEVANLTNENSFELMANLQSALQERRIVKNELEAFKSIKESMPFNAVENYVERKKNCRTAIKYYTDYSKGYFENFSIDPESILV